MTSCNLSLAEAWHPLPIPTGHTGCWLLIKARLHVNGARGETRLRLAFADGRQQERILPVSRKGTLLEWCPVSDMPVRAWLQVSTLQPESTFTDLSLRWISQQEACLRSWRRILPMLWHQPRPARQRIGLTLRLSIRNWQIANQLAGELRDDRPLDDYQKWLAQFDAADSRAERWCRRQMRTWQGQPDICLLLLDSGDAAALQRTQASLAAQWLPASQIKVITADVLSERAPFSGWYGIVPAGSVLAPYALFWFAWQLREQPGLRWIYSDHDEIDASGQRREPHFKPDWSPTLLHSHNYIGWSGLWWANAGDALPQDGAALYRQWLALGQQLQAQEIGHLPALLLHLPPEQIADAMPDKPCPVAAALSQQRIERQRSGLRRVRYPLPDSLPRVTVIIPTRNGLSHLKPCLTGLLERTTYPNLEIIVVDNQSDDPQTLTYLTEMAHQAGVKVMAYDQPFNYAAINNRAIEQASGELVCLLNNDTEVISPGWLEEMVSHLLRPGVGVVGAKLYYSDGTVQHGGDAVGPGGCADHLHHRLPGDAPGYCQRAGCAQELSAVTGACLLTHKHLYLQLGGLNEQALPVAFNDVDYCLRVREVGYRVVWTPFAELYHHESVSRGKDRSPEQQQRAARELAYMKKRWKHVLQHDPYYNPNLNYDRPDFTLGKAPRVTPPWRR